MIAGLMLIEVKILLEEQKITIDASEKAKEFLAAEGYDSNYGARPLRRTIERLIENPISEKILAGEFVEGDCISVKVKEKKIIFSKKKIRNKKN